MITIARSPWWSNTSASADAEPQILGVGRLSKLHGVNEAEFAILVSDPWHGQGLGTELLERLQRVGREEKLVRILGHILPENHVMQHICRKVGFKVDHDPVNHDILAQYPL